MCGGLGKGSVKRKNIKDVTVNFPVIPTRLVSSEMVPLVACDVVRPSRLLSSLLYEYVHVV